MGNPERSRATKTVGQPRPRRPTTRHGWWVYWKRRIRGTISLLAKLAAVITTIGAVVYCAFTLSITTADPPVANISFNLNDVVATVPQATYRRADNAAGGYRLVAVFSEGPGGDLVVGNQVITDVQMLGSASCTADATNPTFGELYKLGVGVVIAITADKIYFVVPPAASASSNWWSLDVEGTFHTQTSHELTVQAIARARLVAGPLNATVQSHTFGVSLSVDVYGDMTCSIISPDDVAGTHSMPPASPHDVTIIVLPLHQP